MPGNRHIGTLEPRHGDGDEEEQHHTQMPNDIEAEGWKFEAISTTFIPQTTTTERWYTNGSREATSGIVLATSVCGLT